MIMNRSIDIIFSMSITINVFKNQILCLQRFFYDVYVSLHMISTRHICSIVFCKKRFKKLKHLYKYIRDQNDFTHESFANFINETRYLICFKICCKSIDFVKHEKTIYDEKYISKFDKFLNTSLSSSVFFLRFVDC